MDEVIRAALRGIIAHYAPETFAPGDSGQEIRERGADSALREGIPIAELLELSVSYIQLPPEFRALAAKVGAGEAVSEAEKVAGLEAWESFRRKEGISQESPAFTPESRGNRFAPSSLPRDWSMLCAEIRGRLLGGFPAEPFENWSLPQSEWSSKWSEAFRAIPSGKTPRGPVTILVPSEPAGSSPFAKRAWEMRIAAANRLRRSPPGSSHCLVAGVLEAAEAETPGFIILDRSIHGRRTLEERLVRGDSPSIDSIVGLGIALCNLLETLDSSGVTVVELPLAAIVFEDNPGLRLTELLDPTGVFPESSLVPEWRALEDPRSFEDLPAKMVPPAQVFAVAAIVLALARGTFRKLSEPFSGSGGSLSLARLGGAPGMEEEDPERVSIPLGVDLSRRWSSANDRIDFHRLVSVLRWALSESPDQRHPSLRAFGAELEGVWRK